MLEVTIASPEKHFITATASHVSLPGAEGDFEIHPNHCPFISVLKTGEISAFLLESEPLVLYVDGGIVEVSRHHNNTKTIVSVLVDSAHFARVAEQEKLESEQRQARRDLQKGEHVNYQVLLKQLSELSAELRTIKKARRFIKNQK
ncbi:MAG: ATP synthase F1 subunit epsilon [Pseudomonadota bacterium]|nr:ATP synthase F1 subunit epsilon [Pseudomonadota bacterium]